MIRDGRFVTSLDGLRDFPGRGAPEIAIAGRSNVGKSSLINKVCNKKGMARSGATPGVTRLVNVYGIGVPGEERLFLMDLPGYGYAKAAKTEQLLWSERIGGYLENSENLVGILHIVDIRHEPTAQDAQMAAWIRSRGLPFRVIATKADKISGAKRQPSLFAIGRVLTVQPWEIIAFSSEDGRGAEEVEKWIFAPT